VQVRAAARGARTEPARTALDVLASHSHAGFVCEATRGGVDVYAENEVAAQAAVDALHAGRDRVPFDIFGPEVRYWPGRPVCEPVMSVHLVLPLVFGAFVRREIVRRRGRIDAAEPARRVVTLRGEAPLAALLGFGRWLDALTDGRGRFDATLLRYAPVGAGFDPDPGPLAA
jgi:hypothetical protein